MFAVPAAGTVGVGDGTTVGLGVGVGTTVGVGDGTTVALGVGAAPAVMSMVAVALWFQLAIAMPPEPRRTVTMNATAAVLKPGNDRKPRRGVAEPEVWLGSSE